MQARNCERWKRLGINALRLYTRYCPVQKGKGMLGRAAQSLMEGLDCVEAISIYGTKFRLRFPEDRGWECLYILGTYESGTSELCKKILKPGDIVFDIGANLGWYTCLFAKVVGSTGAVHAFEPVPWIYEKLAINCALNNCTNVVRINELAIAEGEGTIELFTFGGRPHGETSARMRNGLNVERSIKARATSLNNYVQGLGNPAVTLIKVDVEGSEWEMLKGAEALLYSAQPPMWIFEINFDAAANFGWSPPELLERLQRDFQYNFLRIVSAWGKVAGVRSLEECQHGDNVLCFIPELHGYRLARVRTRR